MSSLSQRADQASSEQIKNLALTAIRAPARGGGNDEGNSAGELPLSSRKATKSLGEDLWNKLNKAYVVGEQMGVLLATNEEVGHSSAQGLPGVIWAVFVTCWMMSVRVRGCDWRRAVLSSEICLSIVSVAGRFQTVLICSVFRLKCVSAPFPD